MMFLANILEGAVAFSAGVGLCAMLWFLRERSSRQRHALEAQNLLAQARADAESVRREAESAAGRDALKVRDELEESYARRQQEIFVHKRLLDEREALVNAQLSRMVETERALAEREQHIRERLGSIAAKEEELAELTARRRAQLQALSGLNEAEARTQLLQQVEQECVRDANSLARHILDNAKAQAEEKARHILSVAIQRYAGNHTFENTTATVALHNDEIKGRIIGREGRNIRAFEAATGVTILVDDTPGAVVISGFDPVRREIARESLFRLIQDGRIHPARIDEVVTGVTDEMDQTVIRLGEDAVARAGLPPLHPEITRMLGRLHFRHSYAQNILDHSVEVAHLTGLMAAELGVDIALAKRAGLLHDIGKAVNHEIEGPHAIVGAEFIRQYGEVSSVVNGVASHHNDVPPEGPLGVLVSAADAISASRPGARSETMSIYLKRIENLEKLANSFAGVEKSYAFQAGRELRVFVQPDHVDDEEAYDLAREIASRIEAELQYPGQIKVTVIRETRCVEVAK